MVVANSLIAGLIDTFRVKTDETDTDSVGIIFIAFDVVDVLPFSIMVSAVVILVVLLLIVVTSIDASDLCCIDVGVLADNARVPMEVVLVVDVQSVICLEYEVMIVIDDSGVDVIEVNDSPVVSFMSHKFGLSFTSLQ